MGFSVRIMSRDVLLCPALMMSWRCPSMRDETFDYFLFATLSKGCPMPTQTPTLTRRYPAQPVQRHVSRKNRHVESVTNRRVVQQNRPHPRAHRGGPAVRAYPSRRYAQPCRRSVFPERRRIAAYSVVIGLLMGASLYYAWEEPRDADMNQETPYSQSVIVTPSGEG